MERKEENKLPEFQSLEEEKEYWEARGPLAEGRKGRINKPKADQRRSSFLSVRLTGEEITDLREVAAIFYTTPSELARGAILGSVKRFKSLYKKDQKERERSGKSLSDDLSHLLAKSKDLRDETLGQSIDQQQVLSSGRLTINSATNEVFLSGKKINLNPAEYRLLLNLIRNDIPTSEEIVNQLSSFPFFMKSENATLEEECLYWERLIKENPKIALYHTALLMLENLFCGLRKSVQELENRLSYPEHVTK